MKRLGIIVALFTPTLCPQSVAAQQAGDAVIVIRQNAEIKNDKATVMRIGIGVVYTIKDVRGSWLHLKGIDSGWINKRDVASLEQGISLISTSPGSYSLSMADAAAVIERLGLRQQELDDFRLARYAYQEALRIKASLRGIKEWQVVDARLRLEYVDLLSKLSVAQRKELADAQTLQSKVSRLQSIGYYNQAIPDAERVIQTYRRILGERHRFVADGLQEFGTICTQQGYRTLSGFAG